MSRVRDSGGDDEMRRVWELGVGNKLRSHVAAQTLCVGPVGWDRFASDLLRGVRGKGGSMKHTPGPFEAVNVSPFSCEIRDATGFVVATVGHTQGDVMDGRKGGVSGNAVLLAAAPSMLAALKLMVLHSRPYHDGDGAAWLHTRNIAEEAIARAEGGGE